MTVQIVNAMIYSTQGEMAYQIDYSEGTQVRSVISRDGWIRKEWKKNGIWVQCGKPYKVQKNAKRHAERTVEAAKKFLA